MKAHIKKALSFIDAMRCNEIPCQVGTTVINQTEEELEKLTAIVKEHGASLLEMGLVSVQGNAKENKLISHFTQEKLNKFLRELSDQFSSERFLVKFPSEKAVLKTCGAGCQIIVIKANKDITICPTAEFKLGNINEQSIEEIMKKCGFKFKNITSPNERLCGECKNQSECAGCISKALVLKDTVGVCPWFEDQREYLLPYVG